MPNANSLTQKDKNDIIKSVNSFFHKAIQKRDPEKLEKMIDPKQLKNEIIKVIKDNNVSHESNNFTIELTINKHLGTEIDALQIELTTKILNKLKEHNEVKIKKLDHLVEKHLKDLNKQVNEINNKNTIPSITLNNNLQSYTSTLKSNVENFKNISLHVNPKEIKNLQNTYNTYKDSQKSQLNNITNTLNYQSTYGFNKTSNNKIKNIIISFKNKVIGLFNDIFKTQKSIHVHKDINKEIRNFKLSLADFRNNDEFLKPKPNEEKNTPNTPRIGKN